MEVRNPKLTKEVARIHAHLCGDGYISTYLMNRNMVDIIRHNRKKKIRRVWIEVRKKGIFEFFDKIDVGKSRSWRMPKEIIEWVHGIF
jgi:hypothetical protein